ncbi:hypothetical protein P7H20_08200 [Paenibacillus larvae]|nr:hypothetical protein [Paenibacillus larvae]MDT2274838.1 hypothetical protein [Paenibacillus larvae]
MHTDSIRSTFQLASLLLQYPGDRFQHEAEDHFREWLDIQEEEGTGRSAVERKHISVLSFKLYDWRINKHGLTDT